MAIDRTELRRQINKRLTLNLLIQGAAQHAFLTSHYLVRDELNAIDPRLLPLYDEFALYGFLQYWYSSGVLVVGYPPIFWRRAGWWPHPSRRHALLARHGLELSNAARDRALARAREKNIRILPGLFSFKLMWMLNRLGTYEINHRHALVELAKKATTAVWQIPEDRIDGHLGIRVGFGKRRWPTNFTALVLRGGAVGYGGVLPASDGSFRVTARAYYWPILSHEMTKGVVELIFLHGLCDLPDDLYRATLRATDRIDFEPWMLQTGCELWRRLLPLLPDGVPVSQVLMRIAQLEPLGLEGLMLDVVETPDGARRGLAELCPEGGAIADLESERDPHM